MTTRPPAVSVEDPPPAPAAPPPPPPAGLFVLIRTALTGVLMGLANLIPGVSGGTMVLAMGLYQEFIDSVADVTALRLSARRLTFLFVLGGAALVAIVALSGAILYLLFHYPVAMFALFIGLTLGGAPLLAARLRPVRADAVVATLAGLALMLGVLALRTGRGFPHNLGMDFVSGVVGATTMVLPGVSGSYMLLVMDQYERVLGAVSDLKDALRSRDMSVLRGAVLIVAPVGVGALLGIALLSNVLKLLLRRFPRPTLGVLLGILLGSVLGLWPFGREPSAKALERRSVAELHAFVAAQGLPAAPDAADPVALATHVRAHWSSRTAPTYTPGAVALAVVCVAGGFVTTLALSRFGEEKPTRPSPS